MIANITNRTGALYELSVYLYGKRMFLREKHTKGLTLHLVRGSML